MKVFSLENREKTIEKIVSFLAKGKVIAIPTDTCYGLAARARDLSAVKKVFSIKNRVPTKPIAIFLKGKKDLNTFANVERLTFESITSLLELSGKFTFIVKAKTDLEFPIPYIVKNQKIGVRIPSYALPREIVKKLGEPITATSANKSGEPPIYQYQKLKTLEIQYTVKEELPKTSPSTVIDFTCPSPKIMREGAVRKEKIISIIQR